MLGAAVSSEQSSASATDRALAAARGAATHRLIKAPTRAIAKLKFRIHLPPPASLPRTASRRGAPGKKSRRFYGRRLPVWEETRAPEAAHLQPVSGVKLT